MNLGSLQGRPIPFLEIVLFLFKDGLNTEPGTSSGIFSDDMNISLSLRFPKKYKVFQAEIENFSFEAGLLVYMSIQAELIWVLGR